MAWDIQNFSEKDEVTDAKAVLSNTTWATKKEIKESIDWLNLILQKSTSDGYIDEANRLLWEFKNLWHTIDATNAHVKKVVKWELKAIKQPELLNQEKIAEIKDLAMNSTFDFFNSEENKDSFNYAIRNFDHLDIATKDRISTFALQYASFKLKENNDLKLSSYCWDPKNLSHTSIKNNSIALFYNNGTKVSVRPWTAVHKTIWSEKVKQSFNAQEKVAIKEEPGTDKYSDKPLVEEKKPVASKIDKARKTEALRREQVQIQANRQRRIDALAKEKAYNEANAKKIQEAKLKANSPAEHTKPVVPETVVAETVVAETVVAETVVAETVVAETVVAETVVAETVVAETEAPETVVAETVVAETVVAETVVAETVVAETEAPEDAAYVTMSLDKNNWNKISSFSVWDEIFDPKDIKMFFTVNNSRREYHANLYKDWAPLGSIALDTWLYRRTDKETVKLMNLNQSDIQKLKEHNHLDFDQGLDEKTQIVNLLKEHWLKEHIVERLKDQWIKVSLAGKELHFDTTKVHHAKLDKKWNIISWHMGHLPITGKSIKKLYRHSEWITSFYLTDQTTWEESIYMFSTKKFEDVSNTDQFAFWKVERANFNRTQYVAEKIANPKNNMDQYGLNDFLRWTLKNSRIAISETADKMTLILEVGWKYMAGLDKKWDLQTLYPASINMQWKYLSELVTTTGKGWHISIDIIDVQTGKLQTYHLSDEKWEDLDEQTKKFYKNRLTAD